MLKVDQYELIRTSYLVYGKSINQIKHETDHLRKIIRKAISGECLGYKNCQSQPFPVLDPY